MRSRTTARFRLALSGLPDPVQRQARHAYEIFKDDPYHPSLRFKRVHPIRPIYSARISRDYRAVGIRDGDEVVWFWVGSRQDYERLIAQA